MWKESLSLMQKTFNDMLLLYQVVCSGVAQYEFPIQLHVVVVFSNINLR